MRVSLLLLRDLGLLVLVCSLPLLSLVILAATRPPNRKRNPEP